MTEENAMSGPGPRVGLIMGSDSDWSVMDAAAEALADFEVPFEVGVVSAHRTPTRMMDYARGAADRELRDKMVEFQEDLEAMVLEKDEALRRRLLQ